MFTDHRQALIIYINTVDSISPAMACVSSDPIISPYQEMLEAKAVVIFDAPLFCWLPLLVSDLRCLDGIDIE